MRAPFVLTSGVVIVRFENKVPLFLILRAYANWDFPKGRVEPGEDPLQAAKRETQEETGITDLNFRWGEDFIQTEPYAKNKIGRFYLAETSASEVKLSWEHHEYRWLPYEGAMELLVPRLKKVLEFHCEQIKS